MIEVVFTETLPVKTCASKDVQKLPDTYNHENLLEAPDFVGWKFIFRIHEVCLKDMKTGI